MSAALERLSALADPLYSLDPAVSMILRSLQEGGKVMAIGTEHLVNHLLKAMLHREAVKRPFPAMTFHKDFLLSTQIEALGTNVDTLVIFKCYHGPDLKAAAQQARLSGVATLVISAVEPVDYLPDINIVTTITGGEEVIERIVKGVESALLKV